jgi:hypothetical protein
MSILKSAGPVLGLKEVKCKHYAGLNHSGLTLEFTPSSTQMSTWQGSGMVSLQKVTKTFFRIHQISPKNRTLMSFAPPAVRRLFKTGRTGESKKQ